MFIVLDPFWYTTDKPQGDNLDSNWGWTLGREQYDWLKTILEVSAEPFKFVFIHHLVGGAIEARGGIEFASFYEWGGNNSDGSYGFDEHRLGWGLPIHQLLVANGVSIVFHGHDHVFVKQDLDGIIYQEVPVTCVSLPHPNRSLSNMFEPTCHLMENLTSKTGRWSISIICIESDILILQTVLQYEDEPKHTQ